MHPLAPPLPTGLDISSRALVKYFDGDGLTVINTKVFTYTRIGSFIQQTSASKKILENYYQLIDL